MFEFIRGVYKGIKRNYRIYRGESSRYNQGRVLSFFKSIFNYLLRRPEPFVFSPEDQEKFEKGLDSRLKSDYAINYRPGEIRLERRL